MASVSDWDAQFGEAEAKIARYWWLWMVAGVAWVIVALVVLQFDQASIKTVGVLIGIMFLVAGGQNFAIAGLVGRLRWVYLFFGGLLIGAGVLSLIQPEETFAGVADILGFLFLLVGVFWTVQAFTEREQNQLWWLGLIAGVAMIVLAFWTSGQFFIDKQYLLLVFAGIWALMQGVTDIVRAFAIRSLRS
jgi:uncharacterized membrane protein HdeD (DUF308 family)